MSLIDHGQTCPTKHAMNRWLTDRIKAPGRAKRRDLLCLLLLGVIVLVLFAPHLLGRSLFVGDADRLNTFLNVRKYTADSIRDYGRVTTWNDRMFLGLSTSGLPSARTSVLDPAI